MNRVKRKTIKLGKQTINCSFILPATSKSRVDRFIKDVKSKFAKAEVIPIFGAASFFSAWGAGIKRATKKFLVFTHQDTQFLKFPDLEEIFKPKIGMVGVAGSREINKNEPWWYSPQRLAAGKLSGGIYHETSEFSGVSYFGPYGEVVVLDGVCLVTTKDRLKKIGGLPQKDYGAWDFYDQIISLEFIKHGFKLLTVPILMTHFSTGKKKRPTFMIDRQRFVEEYLV